MREGETLKAYFDRYWEMYNEIEGNYDDVAISIFKRGLPTKHGLRKSLTGKPVTSVRQLMDKIDKYKRVEEDQQMGTGKAKVVPQERRDFRSDRIINNNRPRRDYPEQSGSTGATAVHAVFREPLHKILEMVKGEPNLRNHLDRLVREGKLRHLLHRPEGWKEQSNIETRQSTLRPPLGTINVIFATPGRTGSSPSKVMSVGRLQTGLDDRESKRARVTTSPLIGFLDEDKQGTLQPHDDALVVTLRIGGYDVKRVLVNQGSAVEVMYPDLYKGLNLKPEDLSAYDSPLVNFEGKIVIPKGMIRLPVQTYLDVVEVDFIVVDAYSPYTAIVARPWFHALGAVSSTLHQKVKYPSGGGPAMEVSCEDLEKVLVGSDPKRFFQVGSELPPHEKSTLIDFLRQNVDVFAWDPYEASGVDSDFI
ncbi:uncharacterized protein LOC115950378 [Quercus lobata]|uniref:uncharacterized protein LOC115950378 n=1 Tax=Quercus lobata TaxID=97700 RepID=UPI0012450D78|nr:uncharacterized protein LOC115950378 [Quercus lobata]